MHPHIALCPTLAVPVSTAHSSPTLPWPTPTVPEGASEGQAEHDVLRLQAGLEEAALKGCLPETKRENSGGRAG